MKIGIVGRRNSKKSKAFQYFKTAAKRLNISVEYYRPSDLIIEVDEEKVSILNYNMEPIQIDGIIDWIPYENKYNELFEAFSFAGIPCINSASAVRNCRNKILTNMTLNRYKISQPKTIFIPKLSKIPKISLKTPVVYKKKNGCKGKGAQKFYGIEDMNNFLEKMMKKKDIYLQEYVKNNGWDMRVIVVGDKVIGGIKKTAKKGEWRTHVAHGGQAEAYELNDTIKSMCLEATKAMHLNFAGIDIIQDTEGNYSILEVNGVPGLSIFHEATGIDIAYEILKYFIEELLDQSEKLKAPQVNYYQIVSSKMEKTKIILNNPLLVSYIPETLYLNANNLKRMLNEFKSVVFKPESGSGGKYVGLIRQNIDSKMYTIHYKTKFYNMASIDEIIQFIVKLKPTKKFLIQKAIDLLRYNNNPVDVRIFMQKPYDNWEITGTFAKVAAKNKMVTNLCNDGSMMHLIDVIKNNAYDESDLEKLRDKMNQLAYDVADTLIKVYPGLRELGLDIGIDNHLHPWVLEVNTKPCYSQLSLLEDKAPYNLIDNYHNLILDSIEYYDRR
ncbi:RimK family alpha-L-glutamate ligase [Vallitalea okinawensis]|uniref:RimK family alpha-L-glutamate ligase n=1 Tax=Vallitalea okinawensis TaxID=2078660 RepID=UPI000CFD6906|nr:RimK family alpha-L-glutamate ligase [Vallitalea okinawensis]